MDQNKVNKILAEFFRDSLREDAAGVGDWFAQGGDDIEEFIAELDVRYPAKK